MRKLILISSLICNFALACPSNVQKIQTGTPANCDGWLVSNPTMQKMAKSDEELEISRKLILSQSHLIKLSEVEIDFYKRSNESSRKELLRAEQNQWWIGAGAFALGVLMTGIAAKAAIESIR